MVTDDQENAHVSGEYKSSSYIKSQNQGEYAY